MNPFSLTSSPTIPNFPVLKANIYKYRINSFSISLSTLTDTIQIPKLHAHLLKTGLQSDIYTSNTLINQYSSSGLLSHAQQVFDEMSERNLVSWTCLISGYTKQGKSQEALEIFLQLLGSGLSPNEFAFGSALRACTESGNARFGSQLHGLILKIGLIQNKFVVSGLIVLYSRIGDLSTAHTILSQLRENNAVSWTSMVVGYSNGGCYVEAVSLFAWMMEADVLPSKYTLTSVLKACSCLDSMEEGLQVHGYALKTGFGEDIAVRVSLINLNSKFRDLPSANAIYSRTTDPDVMLCTAMIGGYVLNEQPRLAIMVFLQMLGEFKLLPNEFTYGNVISACSELDDSSLGACFHALVIKTGHASMVHVEGSLLNMYAKSGKMGAACRVFDKMTEKDSVSRSSLLSGFSSNGCDEEALEFYATLHRSFVQPDPFSLASAITSCAKLADQLRGQQIHAQVIKHGHESDTCISSALVDMYSNSGAIEDAVHVFDCLSWRDRIAWTAMIDGYAQHGLGQKALESFKRMEKEGVRPNGVTFVSLLYACSHAGLVEEGRHYFHLMSSYYGIEPVLHHYASFVDLLGRAGLLEEALEFIKAMPVEPSPLVWRTLMGACTIHNNLKLGIYVAERLIELDPGDDSAYVLLANIYTAAGKRGESSAVRKTMKNKGIKKVPGLSWIEVAKTFHVFGARDSIHPQKGLIYEILDDLKPDMKKAGYVPKEGYPNLQDVDEVESLVCHHSEKLALGFGLLNTPKGVPIRIFKNLRVCGDCHNAIKVISLIKNRKIVVRDVSRFHHFKGGVCSCGDYW